MALGCSRIPVFLLQPCLKIWKRGATVDQITEWFDVSREQIDVVLEFAAQSLGPEPVLPGMVLGRMTTGAALVAAMQSSPYREIEIYAPGGPMPVRET